tara:strand:+ start:11283 stop:11720 length:438 start_codon:yes stop_codon:yes gene_type:complete
MFEIQDAAKAAFKASPKLYPIINGIVRDEDEDTVDVNLTLLAIDLFRNREDKWCTGLKRYADEVKEAFEYYIEELRNNAVELFVGIYTGEFPNPHCNLRQEFGDYVRDWIKNNGDGDELKNIAYNFVVYDDGKYLITNQDASKVV